MQHRFSSPIPAQPKPMTTPTPWCVDAGDRWCIIRSVCATAQTTTTLCGFDVAIDSRREQRPATCPRCIEISNRNSKTNTHNEQS